jgi:DNA-binding transcriptional regulator PaaX
MNFNPKTHIIGKVYDLTQENMCAMLLEIERLRTESKVDTQAKMTMREDAKKLWEELWDLREKEAKQAAFIELVATPKREDGTYNLSREALEQRARELRK